MNYDIDKILDIDCESFLKDNLPIPTPLELAADLREQANFITSILESNSKSKNYQQHDLTKMASYKQEAIAVSYFLMQRAIPGVGIEQMKTYTSKLQKLSKYNQDFLVYLNILK